MKHPVEEKKNKKMVSLSDSVYLLVLLLHIICCSLLPPTLFVAPWREGIRVVYVLHVTASHNFFLHFIAWFQDLSAKRNNVGSINFLWCRHCPLYSRAKLLFDYSTCCRSTRNFFLFSHWRHHVAALLVGADFKQAR